MSDHPAGENAESGSAAIPLGTARRQGTDRVTLLICGDTVFVYASDNPNIGAMEAVLDVVHPGLEVERRTVPRQIWEKALIGLAGMDVEVVDVDDTDAEATS